VYAVRPLAHPHQVERALADAAAAFAEWRLVPLADRIAVVLQALEWFEINAAMLAEELTWQMGRPIRYAPGEIAGLVERGRTMAQLAPSALADLKLGEKAGFERWIRRAPLGPVFVLAPWNYPYLTAVNAVVPALLAGNSVLLKHSALTPICAERFKDAFVAAGLPGGVFQALHLSHDQVARMVEDPRVAHVAFCGSVGGGRAVHKAAAGTFKSVGLELGGKDPAYVRVDADLEHAVPNLVEGVTFNSGQSCCGVERIYVHQDRFDAFVESFVAETRRLILGDPTNPATTLGPMVRPSNAQLVLDQVAAAVASGAKTLIPDDAFPDYGLPYLAPQVLVDVDHSMAIMAEETFGPAVGIMSVRDDDQAVALMNDSRYGLTASIWTRDRDVAAALGNRLETGTVFMNRCDYLDPELAWVGVKDSGRGCTLSTVGFEQLTRPKSFHLRIET
jgi:acyl-CoA reductase-like NAD-dependent aldehyde dehydrogenase